MKYSAARLAMTEKSAFRSEEVDMSLRCDGAIARDKLCTCRKRSKLENNERGEDAAAA